jgi:hypothetical protein
LAPSPKTRVAQNRLSFAERPACKSIQQPLPPPQTKDDFFRDLAVIAVPIPETPPPPLKDLALKNATRALGMSAPDARFLLKTAPAKSGERFATSAEVLDLTSKMDRDGSLTRRRAQYCHFSH